jgi:hypothetical protein
MRITILQNRNAIDVLHDEVREPLFGGAHVEQPSNVWMVERSQDLAFRAESSDQVFRVQAATHDLHGDLLLEPRRLAFGEVDLPHTATAEHTHNTVRADLRRVLIS